MRFLIVGLGSMGKRRVRCLHALGHRQIWGFDIQERRREETRGLYGIAVEPTFEAAFEKAAPDALIISVSPLHHHIYMKAALAAGRPFFVEASVVDTDMEQIIADARRTGVVCAPSCTLRFHPAIARIKTLVAEGRLGNISNILYHCGQYLPDWHTYESVRDYYVSEPTTGGAREIVPFELTWFTDIFGFPKQVFANFRKTINIEGAEAIDDTYNCLLDYGNFLASMTVDVVSRFAVRRLTINGDASQLVWDWNTRKISLYDPASGQWQDTLYDVGQAAQQYNQNIGETMYIEELDSFIQAFRGGPAFINTLEEDIRVLRLLYALERADRTGTVQPAPAS